MVPVLGPAWAGDRGVRVEGVIRGRVVLRLFVTERITVESIVSGKRVTVAHAGKVFVEEGHFDIEEVGQELRASR